VLQWNPDIATQLVVASDDDRSPTLQMWDLRNSQSPVKEFVGHTKVCPRTGGWLVAGLLDGLPGVCCSALPHAVVHR
jgi:hypothetical protein